MSTADPAAAPVPAEFAIAGRLIGPAHPPYIIAELSANHLKRYSRALEVLEMAAAQGADAVKLQTYRPETITIDHDSEDFRIHGGLWDGYTLYKLYESAYMPWEWHEPLMRRGRELGIHVFSSPFDDTAVDLLESLEAPAYKIASFEAVDIALIRRAASTRKPLIISTGLANLPEIEEAKATALQAGAGGVALLHCISAYPAPIAESNLRTISDLRLRFPDTVIGLSDHTMGTVVAAAAIALGASIIEKHVTLSRADGGADSAFSLEPDELRRLVEDGRNAWEALGRVHYDLKDSERGNAAFRRSLYICEDLEPGDVLTARNLRAIRPGYGLAPKHLDDLLGRRVTRKVSRGTPADWSIVS
jgi:N-acetylneuraminate synthase